MARSCRERETGTARESEEERENERARETVGREGERKRAAWSRVEFESLSVSPPATIIKIRGSGILYQG